MSVWDWIFPKKCIECGKNGTYICEECGVNLYKPRMICPMCEDVSEDGWVHGRCKSEISIDRLIVGLPYKGLVRQALKKIKYRAKYHLLEEMAELWIRRVGKLDWGQENCWTAVPMYPGKERERGFNQAQIILEQIAEKKGSKLLARTKETKAMYGLSKPLRIENVSGAFEWMGGEKVSQRVILVDDVWTTGATMRECARILKSNGVREVWAVTLSR